MNIRQRMERWEGRECKAYPDPLTHAEPWTIGIGHCGPEVHPDTVWTDEQIDEAFAADWTGFEDKCLENLPWMGQLDEVRRFVLIAMAFQMGVKGMLGFVKTLAAVRDGHYEHAAEMLRQSNWARQTPRRALAMAQQLSSGQWQ